MDYRKPDAKAYAKAHFTGVWAATHTVFDATGRIDEAGMRANLQHWINTLHLSGLFVCGKQGEFFSMSLDERKRNFELVAEVAGATNGRARTVMSCSDTNLDTVLALGRHAQDVGADWIVVHSPVLHFGADTDETIFEYYRHISEQLDIGIALWNHPDCGYTMSPQLCARIAALPSVVAIKYSVPRPLYCELIRLVGEQIQVSTASEEEWLDNIEQLGWRLYLCSTPPFLLQTALDQRINDYTRLAFAGDFAAARKVRDSLEPARQAFRASRPKGKPQAHSKYWQELLGQAGGPVRRPLLQLSDAEKAVTREHFARSGLLLG